MSTATAPPQQSPEDKRRKRLLSYSAKNMFYSLAAVLVLVFVVWALTPNPPELQRRPPEIEKTASFAAAEADWPVWTPEGLVEQGWRGILVNYGKNTQSDTWRLSMTSPRTQFVQLRQAVEPNDEWLDVSLTGLTNQETTLTLTGPSGPAEWEIWTGIDENDVDVVALVLEPTPDQPATTVVNGTADTQEIATFVESLKVAASD